MSSPVDLHNRKTMDRLSEDVANHIQSEAVKILREEEKEVSGELINGFEYDSASKTLGNTAPHARATEFGFLPTAKSIPITRLEKWVKLKLHIGDEKEAKRVAFAIKKKVESRGTRATFYMMRAIYRVIS